MAVRGVFLLIFLPLFFSTAAMAEGVVFPNEELPNESVPPQLDSPKAVISKAVTFESKWEPKISYGWLLDEPFYQNNYTALGITYSWSEFSGITLRMLSWARGLSEYSNQFSKTTSSLQFGRANGPETGYSLSYDSRFLYGKVSFSKSVIIPTTVTTVYELGMIKYGTKSLPFGGVGLVNAWYLSPSWGLNIGLRLYMRQTLDPLSADLKAASAVPSEGSFTTSSKLSTSFDLGLQYLF